MLDVLRGVAVLGILLVNVDFMRGPDGFVGYWSTAPAAYAGGADRFAQFVVGWLATGKFVSSFAMMFGVGAALMSARALQAGASPRPMLARRYGWLLLFGLAHMTLLFPGDVLFSYGVAGFLLLAFVRSSPRAMLWWAGLMIAATAVPGLLAALATTASVPGDPVAAGAQALAERAATVAAIRDGSYTEVACALTTQAYWLQVPGLILVPWTLGMFLLGFAAVRLGLLDDLRARRAMLARAAAIGLAAGIPINVVLGFFGPLGALAPHPELHDPVLVAAGIVAQLIGAPVLAIGYMSTIALACLRWGSSRSLARTGRMSLSAYLLQSVLALATFAGLDLYDRLDPFAALGVVAAIWIVVLICCDRWARRFRFGPAEWLWRSLTYGRTPAMRGG